MNQRYNKMIRILTLLIIFITIFVPINVWAYLNDGPGGGAHRSINGLALDYFTNKIAAKDSLLKMYVFDPDKMGLSLKVTGEYVTKSGAWDPEDNSWITTGQARIEKGLVPKSFREWVIEGGYTADEPERYMAMRHFYDPVMRAKFRGQSVPFLTDIVPNGVNPKMDAKKWALTESPFSLQTGLQQLSTGSLLWVKERSKQGAYFAKAWRCLGETMHLMADMCLPAHVRNDGHPGVAAQWFPAWADDPYEDYMSTEKVLEYRNGQADSGILADIEGSQNPDDLFDKVARYTNRSFFSQDTISGTDAVTKELVHNANKERDYDSPKLEDYQYIPSKVPGWGVYRHRTEGVDVIVRGEKDGKPTYSVNRSMPWQGKKLIPVATVANAKLLDFFLPRIKVEVLELNQEKKVLRGRSLGYQRDGSGKYQPASQIFPHVEDTILVFLRIGDQETRSEQPLGEIRDRDFDVKIDELFDNVLSGYIKEEKPVPSSGIQCALGLNMGGILVKSEWFSLLKGEQKVAKPKVWIVPDSIQETPGTNCSFRVDGSNLPKGTVRYEWSFGEGTPVTTTNTGTSHNYQREGNYTITVRAYDPTTQQMIAEATGKAEIAKAANDDRSFCQVVDGLLLDFQSQIRINGAIKYGFTCYAANNDKENIPSGWEKLIQPVGKCVGVRDENFNNVKDDTATSVFSGGKAWYQIRYLNISVLDDGRSLDEEPGPDGFWPAAKYQLDIVVDSERKSRASKMGRLGLEGLRAETVGDISWGWWRDDPIYHIVALRGPIRIEAEVAFFFRGSWPLDWRPASYRFELMRKGWDEYGRKQLAIWWDDGDKLESDANEWVSKLPDMTRSLVQQVIAGWDAWANQKIGPSTGLKGIYPSDVRRYVIKPEEIGNGFQVRLVDGKLPWLRDYEHNTYTQCDYYRLAPPGPSVNKGETIERYSVNISTERYSGNTSLPLLKRPREIYQYFVHGMPRPKPFSLTGADEAITTLFRDLGVNCQTIAFRRANIVVNIRGAHQFQKSLAPTPNAEKIAKLILTRLKAR